MGSDTMGLVVLSALGGLLFLVIVVSLVFNVSGTWERIPTEKEMESAEFLGRPVARELMVLGQVGPFIRGRRELPGGYQEISGTIFGRTLKVNRRDHGVPSLVKQGFPEPIAKLVNGDITGRMKLKIISGGLMLDGTFQPQKIEFTHRPPKVTGRHFLAPKPRRYRRLTAKEVAEADKVLAPQAKQQA